MKREAERNTGTGALNGGKQIYLPAAARRFLAARFLADFDAFFGIFCSSTGGKAFISFAIPRSTSLHSRLRSLSCRAISSAVIPRHGNMSAMLTSRRLGAAGSSSFETSGRLGAIGDRGGSAKTVWGSSRMVVGIRAAAGVVSCRALKGFKGLQRTCDYLLGLRCLLSFGKAGGLRKRLIFD